MRVPANHRRSLVVSVADMQFKLVYFPTAYGSVDPLPDPVPVTSGTPDGNGSVVLGGLTQREIDTERAEAETFDVARLERELATMKARIEAMQQLIDSYGNDHR